MGIELGRKLGAGGLVITSSAAEFKILRKVSKTTVFHQENILFLSKIWTGYRRYHRIFRRRK